MTRRSKLLRRALSNPAGLRFEELCKLAEQLGFERDQTQGLGLIEEE